MLDALSKFRDAILSAGMTPPDTIEAGRFHRFPGIGKSNGNTAGWCKLFADGVGGSFGDYATGLQENWQSGHDKPKTKLERAEFAAQIKQARREADARRQEAQEAAANKAALIWNEAVPCPTDQAYLLAKGIQAHGARLHGAALVVPVRVGAKLASLQFIGPDGGKKFLTDGRIAGGYFSIGNPTDAAVMCIAEGFATGATISEATGYPVAVAFNAGNMGAVAKAMRQKFTDLSLILCGDADLSGTGQKAATDAARDVGARVPTPPQ